MTAVPARSERLLNLLAMLVDSRRGVTLEEIAAEPSLGYTATGESLRRAFERDKKDLRAMGVEIVQTPDGDRPRYRVRPEDLYLSLDLDEEERTALNVAVSATALDRASAVGGLSKLGGSPAAGIGPLLAIPMGKDLAVAFEGLRDRRRMKFMYATKERSVAPFGITSRFGAWYVVGEDAASGSIRTFRTDRMSEAELVGPHDAFTIPDGFRAEDHLGEQPWDFGDETPTTVTVRVEPSHADALLRRLDPGATTRTAPDGRVDIDIEVRSLAGLRSVVLGMLDDAEVISPPAARAAMRDWLAALAAEGPNP